MDMNKSKFWITCFHCKRKIGIPAEVVFKYLDRLMGDLEGRHESRAPKPKTGCPTDASLNRLKESVQADQAKDA